MSDLISRSELLKKEWLTEAVDGYPIRVVEVGDILDAPAIEAEPVVHAKWVKITAYGSWWYGCSHCQEHIPQNSYGHDYFSSRCPKCGAHMTLESEGTDE